MTQDLRQMTNTELRQYISAHRNDEELFSAALEVLINRRDPNIPSQPYPFSLKDPEGEIRAILIEKLGKIEGQ
jgi:hypothetical protein